MNMAKSRQYMQWAFFLHSSIFIIIACCFVYGMANRRNQPKFVLSAKSGINVKTCIVIWSFKK